MLMTQFYAKSQSADVVSRAAYDSLLRRIEAVEAAQRDYANSDDVDGSTGATRGTQEKSGYKKKKSKVVLFWPAPFPARPIPSLTRVRR